jgi:hypothetical protein
MLFRLFLTPSGHRRCIAAFEKMSRHDAMGPLFDPIVGSIAPAPAKDHPVHPDGTPREPAYPDGAFSGGPDRAQVGNPRPHPGVGKGCVDFMVELVDQT